jgi:hypothetical protein
MALVANIDSSGVGVHDRQLRIARRHPPPQLPPLRTVHPASFQPLESGHSSLCHPILLKSDFSDPGSARLAKKNDRLSSGVDLTFFKAGSPPINASRQPKSR